MGASSGSSLRVGAVDLGTNSTRLLIADVEYGRVDEVGRALQITRLGEGVDERRRLLPLPVARVRNVLSEFRRELDRLGAERTLAVATSAVRDAENGEAFLGEIERSYGFSTRLLSGDEEAQFTYRGVTAGKTLEPATLVVDIGGGSTELIQADRRTSLDVGSVRLTERFGEAAEAIREYARGLTPELDVRAAVGVAGTITSLAALDLGLVDYDPDRVHGHVLTATAVDEQLARLAAMPLEERRRLPGLEPERAPVIVAGAAILQAILSAYDLDAIEVSEHDLLYGAALAAAELPEPAEGDAPPGAFTCC
jgi:exopolyphosphatase / guanosine-5'-triphosphate,3'-diphosphate pyrophosphatase